MIRFILSAQYSARTATTILAILILLVQAASAASPYKKWEVVELKFMARKNYPNPYLMVPADDKTGLLTVEFRGQSGAAKDKVITLTGFWDGGQIWKVRFAAPWAGTWEYRSKSSDPGLNNIKGKVEIIEWDEAAKVSNPTRRGLVQVMKTGPEAGHFFQYADGTPFLWIGDTWWNWTERAIKFSTYKGLVDDRAAKGFNVGQLFVPANGWRQTSSLLDESYSILDVAHMRRVDSLILYANQKGITIWIHGWWSRKDLDKTAGAEKIKRWQRYLIDRLGAYNVIWVAAGEYNLQNYGGMGLPFWKSLGAFIKASDPYDRIVSVHNTPPFWDGGKDAPQWSTAEILHEEKWLDYNQSQVGHGRWCNELIPDVVKDSYGMKPAKPIVVTEPWYEFVEGNPTAADIRFGLWTAILSGAAGHTYGGGHVWLAYVPENPVKGGHEPMDRSLETTTYDYPGAISMGIASGLFRNIEWWKMSPHSDLVHEYADKYCMALPGVEYVLYCRWGGIVKVDLRPSAETDVFEYRWLNPGDGKYSTPKITQGGDVRIFSAPEGYPNYPDFKDWVLHIRKK